jgi:hypothetical protein
MIPFANKVLMKVWLFLQVIDDVWENFFDMRYKHINSPGKSNYMLMLLVSQMLNFT